MNVLDPFGILPRATRYGVSAGTAAASVGARTAITVQRVLEERLADVVTRVLIEQRLVERIADELVASGAVDRMVDRALESPHMTELVERVLESQGMDRLVAQVLESRLVDTSVARVLASEELWLVVDEVARSPAVTAAISQQGAGFADQIATEVGQRSRRADAWVERAARRMLHRHPRPPDLPDPATP
jgi:hypothetical protein